MDDVCMQHDARLEAEVLSAQSRFTQQFLCERMMNDCVGLTVTSNCRQARKQKDDLVTRHAHTIRKSGTTRDVKFRGSAGIFELHKLINFDKFVRFLGSV
ncbi:hypothetical protein CEP54_008376 [Fusarium duplospermum]|uniref:Uncharacterized protein n=1 Tax=Fusarium duplospermum TaxID=1325734 RepID=A0A428PW87_9HYPO|nr:hypothetical protein CEP54_008376 [Fusarium duplospermum]